MWKIQTIRLDQSGMALISAMLAIFILTIAVAALAVATMGETGLSFDHSRSVQALHLAEAGAYRALAELRRRITFDVDNNVQSVDSDTLYGYCQSNEGWRVVETFGGPGWDKQQPSSYRRAVLAVGTEGAQIEVWDANNHLVGSFYATIYVRPADNSAPGSNICSPPSIGVSYQMRFDYFIVATGQARNTQRTVCLKNPGNLKNCGEWLASTNPGATMWDSVDIPPSPLHGWLILIEKASYARWALMLLKTSGTWLTDTSIFPGPVHTNDRWHIWGHPEFRFTVTQVERDVMFGNGGNPIPKDADTNPLGGDVPVYKNQERGMLRGPDVVKRIDPPRSNSPFWAVLGDPEKSGQPGNLAIRSHTHALDDNPGKDDKVPLGIYLMDQCSPPPCGGIFVQGDVKNIVLGIKGNKQTIIIVTDAERNGIKYYILDSASGTIEECTADFATCGSLGRGFNGMIFVNGNIGNPDTGLYGTVQENTRLTIAADGEIRITDHLVYQSPPYGPNDPIGNVLGLYAWCSNPVASTCPPPARNVTIDGALAPDNLFIDAAVLAPWGKFWVDGWNTLALKGTLRFLGGTVQDRFGEWGSFDGKGRPLTGFTREMTFDDRFLTNNAPPFFPLTIRYTALRWPNLLSPDPLYDRPLWEELVGR